MKQISPSRCDTMLLQSVFDIDIPQNNVYSHEEIHEIKVQKAKFILENARILGSKLNISPIDVALGHPRVNILLMADLFNLHIGINSLQSDLELASLRSDMVRSQTEIFMLKSELQRLELRKGASPIVSKSAQTDATNSTIPEIERLKSKVFKLNVKLCEYEKQTDEFRPVFQNSKASLSETLSETRRLLCMYQDRRSEIFENSNTYTIAALDNEGKRVEFHVPAPGIKQKCSFALHSPKLENRTCPPIPGQRGSSQPHKQDGIAILNVSEMTQELGINMPSEFSDSNSSTSMYEDVDSLSHSMEKSVGNSEIQTECPSPQQLDLRPQDLPTARSLSAPPDVLLEDDNSEDNSVHIYHAKKVTFEPTTPKSRRKSVNLLSLNADFSDLEESSQSIHRLVIRLMEESMQHIQQIQLLAAKLDEMTWLNNVMGEKIREYSEDMIKGKKKKFLNI
jgi:hypothetical protein